MTDGVTCAREGTASGLPTRDRSLPHASGEGGDQPVVDWRSMDVLGVGASGGKRFHMR